MCIFCVEEFLQCKLDCFVMYFYCCFPSWGKWLMVRWFYIIFKWYSSPPVTGTINISMSVVCCSLIFRSRIIAFVWFICCLPCLNWRKLKPVCVSGTSVLCNSPNSDNIIASVYFWFWLVQFIHILMHTELQFVTEFRSVLIKCVRDDFLLLSNSYESSESFNSWPGVEARCF